MKQILWAFFAVFFLLASCTLTESDDGASSLTVSLPDSNSARALQLDGKYENEDVKSYKIAITSGGSTVSKESDSGGEVVFPDISEGLWNVSVEAFSGEGGTGILVAKGTASANVSGGENSSVSVSLVKVDHSDMIVYDSDMYDRVMATESKTFRVVTSEQFQQLQTLSKDSGKTFSGATILLMADVESSSDNYLKDFEGTFDGGKHTVTLNGYGLVAGTLSGTVRNVITDGLAESSSGRYIGAIAEMTNGATISCCINRATIKYGEGGIVGMLYDGHTVIERCGNEGTFIPSPNNDVAGSGGILGTDMYCRSGSTSATISNCYNAGTVEKSYNAYCGGIVGYGCYAEINIENCYDRNSGSTYNYDIIGSIGSSNVVTISDCYSAQQKGTGSKCGTLVTDFSDPTQFAGFDFDTVWEIKDGHPVLRDIQ